MEIDVEALQKRLEARAKAMIQLEEQEVASRAKASEARLYRPFMLLVP